MGVADELEKLQRLHQSGALSDEEYARAKDGLLGAPSSAGTSQAVTSDATIEQETQQWAMLLHLSLLAGFLLPLAGLVLPILIWQMKKASLPGIDVHGKIVANWIITEIIYGVACLLLVFVVVGIPLMIALIVVSIVFPIIGGIKAGNGEVWKYPLSLPILDLPSDPTDESHADAATSDGESHYMK
jgi:hypothetical protein